MFVIETDHNDGLLDAIADHFIINQMNDFGAMCVLLKE
jgi:hypothetical protein